MKKRLVRPAVAASALALCVAPAALAASHSDHVRAKQASSSVTISYLFQGSSSEMAMYKRYATAYHKVNPNVTVNVRVVPFANLLSTIRTQANSSAGPTIANIYDLWLGQLTQGGI